MRITTDSLPLLLLFLSLPLAIVHQYSILEVFLITIGLILLRSALIFKKLSGRRHDKRIILETISVSHYVEKVRWSMDYLGLDYEEEENVGILGILLLGRSVPQLHVPGKGTGISIGNSSDILHYLYGEYCLDDQRAPFLKPTPLSATLEPKFDKLGEDIRRFCYFNFFSSNSPDIKNELLKVWGMNQPNIPQWQKYLLKLLAPFFVFWVGNRLAVTPEMSKKSLKEAKDTLKEVEELLSDGRKFILGTSYPTYIDFHFCSMVAVMLYPPNYGGKVFRHETKKEGRHLVMTEDWRKEVKLLEESIAGKFVMNLYQNLRFKTVHKME